MRTRLISIGVTVWSVLTAVSGIVTSYAGLVAARLGVGIGEATCSPACQSLIGDLYPPEKRSRALGAFMLGLPFGLCLVLSHRRVAGRTSTAGARASCSRRCRGSSSRC